MTPEFIYSHLSLWASLPYFQQPIEMKPPKFSKFKAKLTSPISADYLTVHPDAQARKLRLKHKLLPLAPVLCPPECSHPLRDSGSFHTHLISHPINTRTPHNFFPAISNIVSAMLQIKHLPQT